MEMNFPHDLPISASSTPITLRELDMDILRVLAVAPVTARQQPRLAERSALHGDAALLALFAGSGRANQVARGSFNPHFAVAIDQFGATEHQGETGVYHSASVNRKAARLLRSLAPNYTNQAF